MNNSSSNSESGYPGPINRLEASSTRTRRPGKRILLVDDDPIVLDSLRDVMVSEGYSVIPAENGQQALNVTAHARIDLALLDVNLPGKNCWETFTQLTANDPHLPVIIITGRPNQLFMAVNAGVGALLEKPLDIPRLLEAVTALLTEGAEPRGARFMYLPSAERSGGTTR